MNLEIGILALAAVAALASAAYAWRTSEHSRISTKIAEDEHRKRSAPVSAYLIDGVTWIEKDKDRTCSMAVTITNESVEPTSIIKAELHLHAYDESGLVSQIILQPIVAAEVPNKDMKVIDVPIYLDARGAVSGWFTYHVPLRVDERLRIDCYQIVFTLAGGERADVSQYIMRRIRHEKGEG